LDEVLVAGHDGGTPLFRTSLTILPQRKIGDLELARIRAARVDIEGRQLLSIRYDERLWFYAEKIDPSPLPNTWRNMLGRYEVINPDPAGSPNGIILSEDRDVLKLSYKTPLWHAGENKIYLIPRSNTEALTLGIGRSSGETMRMIKIDGETGLGIWGYNLKKIK
jgi:hypothetical protein